MRDDFNLRLSIYQHSLTSIQDATKWTIGAFAAIGALLVAGLQLSAVGTINMEEPLQLVVALITMAGALVAVGVVLVRASRVLVPPLVTLPELVKRELRARTRTSEPDEFWSFDPILKWIRPERTALLKTGVRNPHDLYQRLRELEGTDSEQLEQFEQDEKRLTDFASMKVTQDRYTDLMRSLLVGGVIVAICVVCFSWAVNSSKRTNASVTQPIGMRVILTGSEQVLHVNRINPACAKHELMAVAVAGELREPEVVTVPTATCPATHLVVRQDIGVAIPTTAQGSYPSLGVSP
jgi:hypothetical protein